MKRAIIYGGFLVAFFIILLSLKEDNLGAGIGLPNPKFTPGVVNLNVTQANINQTICRGGWTATIRPPVSYTNSLKAKQIKEYGYQDANLSNYEEDHLISLELGGSPTDHRNLWPEAYPMARQKDRLESWLKTQVCDKQITLQKAQEIIRTNWKAEWDSVFGKNLGFEGQNGLSTTDD